MAGRPKVTSPTFVRRGHSDHTKLLQTGWFLAAMAVAVDGRLTLIEVAGLEIGVTIRNDR